MNCTSSINPNNNKNAKGFLFFDIIVSITLFFTMMHIFFIIGSNSFFLLQKLIKNAVEANDRLSIVRALALNIPYNNYNFDMLFNTTIEKYTIETRKIVFSMCNNTKMTTDVVTVKKNSDDPDKYVCYMMKNEH